jgi:hypothetical protein
MGPERPPVELSQKWNHSACDRVNANPPRGHDKRNAFEIVVFFAARRAGGAAAPTVRKLEYVLISGQCWH